MGLAVEDNWVVSNPSSSCPIYDIFLALFYFALEGVAVLMLII